MRRKHHAPQPDDQPAGSAAAAPSSTAKSFMTRCCISCGMIMKRRGVAGPDGRSHHGPAREEGDHRGNHRRSSGDARVFHQGPCGRQDSIWWTSWAPGATARTPSTSPPVPCSWRQRRVPRSASTAGAASAASRGSADVHGGVWASTSTCRPRRIAQLHRRGRHRLHVCTQPPPGHEERGAGAKRAGHQDHLQHPRAPDQPGRSAPNILMGVFHPGSGGHPGACAAAPGHRACRGGVRA
jgi:hypothetical protein